MIICVCHRVSEHDIGRHARAGLSFEDIQLELGVATQCGQCERCAREVVARCAASRAEFPASAAVLQPALSV